MSASKDGPHVDQLEKIWQDNLDQQFILKKQLVRKKHKRYFEQYRRLKIKLIKLQKEEEEIQKELEQYFNV